MTGRIDARLAELGLTLPDAPAAAAIYVPTVQTGALVYVSGQVSKAPEGLITGKLGATMDVAAGQQAARACALNVIAQMKAACGGDLDRVRRVVKLNGFVNSAPDFIEQHLVINGASALIGEVFGEIGAHARSAIGNVSLPLGAAVEVEAIFEIA
jgi:enamine deaminase RidA (YjgF/YER057c/UK114 family)